jgi:hypothetical protein
LLLRPADGDAVVAIGQASHAWIAGQLARGWGNARFPRPEPFEEVCLGATQHDIGMATWDLAPDLDPATGLPRPYFAMDRFTHLRLWTEAPTRLLTQSAWAALLTSLHGTSLYERYPPRTDDPAVARAVAAYLDGQRALQVRLAAEVGADEDRLRTNRDLLGLWDQLSIALCEDHERHVVDGVPSVDGPVTLTLVREHDHLTLDPWPMGDDALVVVGEGRRLEGRCADAEALAAALASAVRVALRFVLRPLRVPGG